MLQPKLQWPSCSSTQGFELSLRSLPPLILLYVAFYGSFASTKNSDWRKCLLILVTPWCKYQAKACQAIICLHDETTNICLWATLAKQEAVLLTQKLSALCTTENKKDSRWLWTARAWDAVLRSIADHCIGGLRRGLKGYAGLRRGYQAEGSNWNSCSRRLIETCRRQMPIKRQAYRWWLWTPLHPVLQSMMLLLDMPSQCCQDMFVSNAGKSWICYWIGC